MDRYVRKSDVSHFGLESVDTEKLMKHKVNRHEQKFNIKLTAFKKYMIDKIYKFNPLNNKQDKLVKLLWLSFLFNDMSDEKQKNVYLTIETI